MKICMLLLLASFNSAVARAGHWNGYNNPANMDINRNYIYNVNQLPLRAATSLTPWSETYWPTNMGSINYRWNSPDHDGFYYIPYTKSQILKMSLEELKTLSPAEKYDIYMGNYHYPLYNEVRSYGNPRAAYWSGICDGWSIAAIQYSEPAPVILANPDGVLVPFGSSDVKGLLSFAAAVHFKVRTGQVGLRCKRDVNLVSPCSDVNPGAMHVVLANQIGLLKKAFVVERSAGREIWNQPAYAYHFQILGSVDSEDGDYGLRVHATFHYTDELEDSRWEPVVGTPNFKSNKIEMDYILDLDSRNNIIGGEWIRGSDHPDFLWIPTNHLEFTGSMAGINKIYKPTMK